MKNSILFIALMLLGLPAFCQEGVKFEQLTLNEALAKAKTEGKPLFVDCYTTWCGPCKFMLEKVFTQEKAGEYFNPRFICVKYDLEEGEGPELVKRYNVKAFPTFLILHPDGTVQHRIVGGAGLNEFIRWVKEGLRKNTSSEHVEELYVKGKMNNEQLLKHYYTSFHDKEKSEKILKELTDRLSDLDKMNADYWFIIGNSPYGSENYKFVVHHLPAFRKDIGQKAVDQYLYKTYERIIHDYILERGIKDESRQQFSEIRQAVPSLGLKEEQFIRKLALAEAYADQDVDRILSYTENIKNPHEQEYLLVLRALKHVEAKLTPANRQRTIVFRDRMIGQTRSEMEKKRVEKDFEKFNTNTQP